MQGNTGGIATCIFLLGLLIESPIAYLLIEKGPIRCSGNRHQKKLCYLKYNPIKK